MDTPSSGKNPDHLPVSDEEDLDDPTELDRNILEEEEEQQKLLIGSKSHSRIPGPDDGHQNSRRAQRKERRQKRKGKRRGKEIADKEGTLLYEMEEGGFRKNLSSPSSSSLELDKPKSQTSIQLTRRRRIHRNIGIAVIIAILFSLLTFGSYKMSWRRSSTLALAKLSNGTSLFAPTTVLISLDGFRADFLYRNITPTLNSFIAEGISPKYMLPSFPSVTFPNHYTLVTGLHPESHGVVGNSFWDPDLKEEFFYTDPARSMQPKWWNGGEPLWVTAERQGVKTAIHMWPGSEAHIQLEPTYLDKFNGSEILSKKVDRVLELLDLPESEDFEIEGARNRPQLIAAYVPVVDSDGHKHGPNSTEIRGTIASVDTMLHGLFTGLDQRNLSHIVNIVVVSDHGMASTSVDRLIQLDDLIDVNLVEHIDGWPLYGLRPKDPNDLRLLYDKLLDASAKNPNFDVYLRDQNMPERYHFAKNDRIAPLWVIPKTGWAIVHKEDFDVEKAKANGQIYHPKGLHGYDHEHPLMRAIFVARGPAFPHKPNSRLAPFQNLEVYNIVCDTLGIEPKPNNGTLRLPLKPEGLHSDKPTGEEDMPPDFPETEVSTSAQEVVTSTRSSSSALSTASILANTTQANDDGVKSSDNLWGKWKQMMEDVRAAMAGLIAKLHGDSDPT